MFILFQNRILVSLMILLIDDYATRRGYCFTYRGLVNHHIANANDPITDRSIMDNINRDIEKELSNFIYNPLNNESKLEAIQYCSRVLDNYKYQNTISDYNISLEDNEHLSHNLNMNIAIRSSQGFAMLNTRITILPSGLFNF